MVKSVIGQVPRGDDCYGRENDIAEAWRYVERGESLLLLAPRRSGKSAIMQAMHDSPKDDWTVIYMNLEPLEIPSQVVSRMLGELIEIPKFRKTLEKTSLGRRFKGLFEKLQESGSGGADTPYQIMLQAIGKDWPTGLDDIRDRIRDNPENGKVLMILDELPIVAAKLARQGDPGKADLEKLLNALRELCLNPAVKGRFALIVGGSIGLSNILDRAGIRGVTNHLVDTRIEPWSRETARSFIEAWSIGEECQVGAAAAEAILESLGDEYIPSHVQHALDELRKRIDLSNSSTEAVCAAFDEHVPKRAERALLKDYEARLKDMLSETELTAAMTILKETAVRSEGIPVADIEATGVDTDTFDYILTVLEQDGYIRIDQSGYLTYPARLIRLYFQKKAGRTRRKTS